MQSEQISELATALSEAQAEMANAPMNRTNPHFRSRYADLAAIREATLPPLTKHGLSLYQSTYFDNQAGMLVLSTRLAHKSGQWIESVYPIPFSDKPQIMGSALTYARRYSWAALCGVASEEDDDANAAQEGAKNGAAKRTKAEISEQATWKREESKRVQDDVNQITNFVELERYKKEVLTPEFMARFGNGGYGIDEMFRRREEELIAQKNAEPDLGPPDFPRPETLMTKRRDWLVEQIQKAKDEDTLIEFRESDDFKKYFGQITKHMQEAVKKAGSTKMDALRMAAMSPVEA